jgi:NADH dehydrogenase [ubiquinone] 1 alpha subcomplex assembly factor 7
VTTPLGERIRALIEATGPIPVSQYMALCLGDPEHGYYATRDPLGAAGDFVTAPEISQLFGELAGIWCLAAFEAMGSPGRFSLVELGPGRGTLMADMMRAVKIRPSFVAAASLHLVESSPALRRVQADRLGAWTPVFHDRVDTLPATPLIVVANEFFDALPIRQFVRTPDGWRERTVGLGADGGLAFGAGATGIGADLLPPSAGTAPIGTIVEVNRPAEAIMTTLAERIARHGGALLTFDYGSDTGGTGDTLQAVRRHAPTGVLDDPGEADLTAHVDFAALARAAAAGGARVLGPRAQGRVLLDLGLLERAGALGRSADADGREEIRAAVERLAGEDGMGTLFRALAATSGFDVPGFATPGA